MCISQTHRRINRAPTAVPLKTPVVSLKRPLSVASSSPGVSFSTFEKTHQQQQQQHHHAPIIVHHDYHDFANANPADYESKHGLPVRGGVTTPFPQKLHALLKRFEQDGLSHILSFQPHGRAVMIKDPAALQQYLPHYFKLNKLASFQRQMNLYGFVRLSKGPDRGAYYHEKFLRGREFLAPSIVRVKVKGTGVRARSNPEEEPDFYSMPYCFEQGQQSSASLASSSSSHSSASTAVASVPQEAFKPSSSSSATDMLFANINILDLEPRALPETQTQVQVPSNNNEDLMQGFGNCSFHFCNPFEQQASSSSAQPEAGMTLQEVNNLMEQEAEEFFKDNFEENIFDLEDNLNEFAGDLSDDAVFGDLLEQMIS